MLPSSNGLEGQMDFSDQLVGLSSSNRASLLGEPPTLTISVMVSTLLPQEWCSAGSYVWSAHSVSALLQPRGHVLTLPALTRRLLL